MNFQNIGRWAHEFIIIIIVFSLCQKILEVYGWVLPC